MVFPMKQLATLYLDNNATAPLRTEAACAMQNAMGPPANPSSVHGYGRASRLVVEDARFAVAQLVGCSTSDIVFTSGGTEANNLILRQYNNIITSAIEHDSVRAVNPKTQFVRVKADGCVDCDDLARHVAAVKAEERSNTLISVMAANNETGVIQPLDIISDIASAAGIATHSDMVQVLGKRDLNFSDSNIGYCSISAHKIGGPAGVGALIVRSGCGLASFLKGGGQEQGRRSGTENFIGIAGFGAAAKAASSDLDHFVKMAGWRDKFEKRIATALPNTIIFGEAADRLGNTSCLMAGPKPAETMVMAFDLAGVAVSAGAACSSGKLQPSHVLEAMGAGEGAALAIRVSGGWATKQLDFEKLADVFLHLYKHVD